MDPVRPNVGGAGARSSVRRPGLAVFALAATGIGLIFYAKNNSMRRNEQAQKKAEGAYYVSVDRSGGGI
ncbi:hypothetical protein BKA67DRAFT_652880 [Truncatella angustata]|uniref:Uncharacterized protein n=1 Tax=Truncatella angustata TaxID=152316 RepID=A0A9P9A1K7_9PEZI|nr:uncharacterized protein BKA67DRAFT_652880 [Truncatella angustata]KAH6659656.1 hypothetical protein BKA67DRAFT_652880 [Truncatella angustata]KAH8201247.1 hypothetical protein TruAng_004564 [Truncatella angustata]